MPGFGDIAEPYVITVPCGQIPSNEKPATSRPREAPLILIPAYLIRDTKRSTYDLKVRDDDLATNQALQERLRADFGVTLPDVPDTEDWLPSSYFNAVANAVSAKRRWSIDISAIELGFFSFSKLLMVRDLEPTN